MAAAAGEHVGNARAFSRPPCVSLWECVRWCGRAGRASRGRRAGGRTSGQPGKGKGAKRRAAVAWPSSWERASRAGWQQEGLHELALPGWLEALVQRRRQPFLAKK